MSAIGEELRGTFAFEPHFGVVLAFAAAKTERVSDRQCAAAPSRLRRKFGIYKGEDVPSLAAKRFEAVVAGLWQALFEQRRAAAHPIPYAIGGAAHAPSEAIKAAKILDPIVH